MLRLLQTILVGALMCSPALAAGPGPASTPVPTDTAMPRPNGWQTWTWGNQCFAVLFPEDDTTAPWLRKDGAYLAVKHMPAEGTFDSVAVVSGLPVQKGLTGRIEIDDASFDMLMFSGTGFVSSGEREKKLLNALVSGKKATVTWTTPTTLVVQSYDLSGLGRSKKIIDFACRENDPTKMAKAPPA